MSPEPPAETPRFAVVNRCGTDCKHFSYATPKDVDEGFADRQGPVCFNPMSDIPDGVDARHTGEFEGKFPEWCPLKELPKGRSIICTKCKKTCEMNLVKGTFQALYELSEDGWDINFGGEALCPDCAKEAGQG